MKPNMPRGRRQGNRGLQNRASLNPWDDRSGSSGGPLATDHIQLHDLDLELALLKRKRQLIEEQQQNMLTGSPFARSSQYDYDKPQSYNQQYDAPRQSMSTQSFAQYYDTPGPQFDRFDRKRPAGDSGWQNSSAPKRFGGSQRDPPKQTGGRPGQYPKPSGGGSGAFKQQPPRSQNNQRSDSGPWKPNTGSSSSSWPKPNAPARSRNFNPTRVSKPKPTAAPNNLNSYPVAERKNLVSKASSLAQKPFEQDVILYPNRPGSRQMLGRMELALGSILKDIKQLHGDTAPALGLLSLRIIKQAIRDRIRSAMLGKPVGNAADIIKAYRENNPQETDEEILSLGLEAEQSKPVHKLAIRLIETGNPDKFFKANFNKLVSRQLDKMFNNLHNLYKEEKDSDKSIHEIIDAILKEEGTVLDPLFDLKKAADTKLAEESGENKAAEEKQTGDNDGSTEVKEADSQAQVIDGETIEVEPTDNSKTDNVGDDNTNNDNNDKADVDNDFDTPMDDDDEAETEHKHNDKQSPIIDLSKNDDNIDSRTDDAKKQAVAQFRARFYIRLMDMLIKRRLPYILPKYKDVIIKNILHSDEAYKTTLAHLIIGAKKREQAIDEKASQDNESKKGNAEQKTGGKPLARNLPYFVKVFGHPALPKRKLMQAFLDQFHPASIKKHRGVHNLLFVGFADKEDFDNILAANQTVVGNCTVDIKVSDKFVKPNREEQKAVVKTEEDDAAEVQIIDDDAPIKIEDDLSVKIDAELDDQINDLLTTIREEEERDEAERGEAEQKACQAAIKIEESQDGAESQSEPEKPQENGGDDTKETPEATPAKAAPVASATPAKAAPVASVTPINTTPVASAMPTKTPVANATPTKTTPAANATPVRATPAANATATKATPAASAAPTKATSVASATPTKATPAASATPARATPAANATPAKATPVTSATPAKATNATPAKAAPVASATPAKAAPVASATPAKAPNATPAKAPPAATATTPASNVRTRRASRLDKQN